MSEWLPIESAPRDGRQILIEVSDHVVAAVWSSWGQAWFSVAAVTPVNPSEFMLSSDIMLVHISGIPQRWRPLPLPLPPQNPHDKGEGEG